jgi:DNA-binding transcriptional ArsR family regulator
VQTLSNSTIASSRGAHSRTRIVRAIQERPRNANELAEALDLDHTTIRHHLDVLQENSVREPTGDDYGAVYLFTDQVETHWRLVEEVLETVADEDP